MEPITIYGCKYPTILKVVVLLLSLVIAPILISYWLQNNFMTAFLPSQASSFMCYFVVLLILLLLLIPARLNKGIYIFYTSFLLYKENLSIKDKIVLAFINKDLEKLEKYLKKEKYITIDHISLGYNTQQMGRSAEVGISIYFDVIYKDGRKVQFIPDSTKEQYRLFLSPFINYRIELDDPHHIYDAINQDEVRIYEYLVTNKKQTS